MIVVFSPEYLTRLYRRIRSRRLKALAFGMLRRLRRRHLVIRMDTTNLCNLRCRMCYYSSEQHHRREEMDLTLFRKIANDVFPRTRFLYLSCATEPFMNRHFGAFLEETGAYNVPFTSLCTNGMLLNKELICCMIRSNLTEVMFSVDGATQETYEYIRRGGTWKTLLENLDLLRERKRRADATHPIARINFTCMERNIRELPALVRLANGHGVRNVHVRHLLTFQNDSLNCKEQMNYRAVFNDVSREAKEEAERLGVRLFLPGAIADPTTRTQTTSAGGTKRREANPYCVLPWFQAIIRPNGDLHLCSAFRSFGNLRDYSFDEIFYGPKMSTLRRQLLWRSPDACSWTCAEEAYDAVETEEDATPEPEDNSLVSQTV